MTYEKKPYVKQQLPRHWSPFSRVKITDDGADAIHQAQEIYHRTWGKLLKLCPLNMPERKEALKAMQESCMWLCRGIAVSNQSPDNIAPWEAAKAEAGLVVDDDGWTVAAKVPDKPVITVKRSKLTDIEK